MATRQRLDPADRKRLILDAAAQVAIERGLHALTRELVAERAECSTGLVTSYFKSIPALKREVMKAAIRHGHAGIVADGLALRDPIAHKAPPELLAAARAILATR